MNRPHRTEAKGRGSEPQERANPTEAKGKGRGCLFCLNDAKRGRP